MIWLAIWLTKVTVKLLILSCFVFAFVCWAPIAVTGMLISSGCNNPRAANQWRRSLRWRMPRI